MCRVETEAPQSGNGGATEQKRGGTERKLRRTQSGNREEDPEDTIWLNVQLKLSHLCVYPDGCPVVNKF